jgi:hypothetical protein
VKAGKIIAFFSILLVFLYLLAVLLQLSLQLLLFYARLALWERIQAWKFRRSCGKYVKGASLERLSSLYSFQLRRARKELSVARWLKQVRENLPGKTLQRGAG